MMGFSIVKPDEVYYSNVPDEVYYSNVPDEDYYSNVPDEDYYSLFLREENVGLDNKIYVCFCYDCITKHNVYSFQKVNWPTVSF
jgi:hypothetical protein